jgi:hypothetical protein
VAFAGAFSGHLDFGIGPLMTHGTAEADVFIVLVDTAR